MAYTVDIYYEEADDPGVWVLIVENYNAAHGVFGWQYETAGTYRFRVELYLDGELIATVYTNSVQTARSRVLTEERAALLGARQRQAGIWLYVEDADGNPRDRSSYLTGCEISGHRDSRVTSASVRIRREHGSASLAPELDASPLNKKSNGEYGPAIAIGRRFQIWVCLVAANAATPTFDHNDTLIQFCGRIDEHDFSSSDARFSGRDIHGRLADTWIEEVRTYGAPLPGVPAQEVLQQIFDDNAPGTVIYVPYDIDVEFGLFQQEKDLLLEAGRKLALNAGADLRGLWHDESGTFPLWMYQADMLPTEPSYVFSKFEWLAVTAYRLAIGNIVNVVYGSFVDDSNVRYTIDPPYTDDVSIEKYGRRWMGLDLPVTNPVRTAAAFEALALGALLALSEPDAELEIKTVFFWPAGINRVYGFEPDGVRFAEQRNFACVGYRHVYQKAWQANMEDTFETYLSVRGQPAAALEEYLTKGQISGTPSLPPGEPIPPFTPEPPPPTDPLLTGGGAEADGIFYDVPPASVLVTWTALNTDVTHSIALDRRINSEAWEIDVVMGLDPDDGAFNDTIDGFVNRPESDFPTVTHRVMYRIKLMEDGITLIASRTTNSVALEPA